MYQYIVTAFKVLVGVITNERLAIVAAVALGLMLLWVIFSLVFSFQVKFARGARRINNYVSQNGMTVSSKDGLDALASKMSSEFQRGYKNFNANPGSLPSEHIKRFQSLDVELTGGVFNQNKSIIKTYINFVFAALLLFSIAILSPEEALTGAALGEAAVCPLSFLLVAKIIYYVYTAIRQHQYKVAVDEFNDMLDNMDQAVRQERINVAKVGVAELKPAEDGNVKLDTTEINLTIKSYLDDYFKQNPVRVDDGKINELTSRLEEKLNELTKIETNGVEVANNYGNITPNDQLTAVRPAEEENVQAAAEDVAEPEVKKAEEQEPAKVEEPTPLEEPNTANEPKPRQSKPNKEPSPGKKEEREDVEDNFKLDFSDLIDNDDDEPILAPKRGRGRPKKEVNQPGEFVIKDDKDFEEALSRAEKLMRKNEEPLSPSQTKRIEKQIKELVDAMTKYKESK